MIAHARDERTLQSQRMCVGGSVSLRPPVHMRTTWSFARPKAAGSDEIAESWIDGLPPAETLHLVSLLGTKEDETPEYSFYSFRGVGDQPDGRPTFQEWLDDRYGADRFVIHDYPTLDAGDWSIPQDVIDSLITLILPLLSRGETVVLFDSGGAQRTGQFCRAAGFRRRPWSREKS